jgi:hypothetical protein
VSPLSSPPMAFFSRTRSRLLFVPRPLFPSGLCLRRGSVHCVLRPAKLPALLDRSDLEYASDRRGLVRPSLPQAGHPDLESGITTQPS